MFTIEEILEKGITLAPYNFELFHAFNPNLTVEVYNFLRGNGTEWKIICGFGVRLKYSMHSLESNRDLTLANLKVYRNRFIPDYYLNPENWNYGN
ncbi:hypothetical protein [Flavobacterium soyangense]|uniref:Uncharacterized protein n=1 Tax=Flavobacterium soyangense TaxID=2023265 RepID=A0A930UAL1_9FLAO|nr:hypothetical protein [Flavobacterium soyangense]MBF2710008.1 hypothetical protein [Flavobacterium soyangense]